MGDEGSGVGEDVEVAGMGEIGCEGGGATRLLFNFCPL